MSDWIAGEFSELGCFLMTFKKNLQQLHKDVPFKRVVILGHGVEAQCHVSCRRE